MDNSQLMELANANLTIHLMDLCIDDTIEINTITKLLQNNQQLKQLILKFSFRLLDFNGENLFVTEVRQILNKQLDREWTIYTNDKDTLNISRRV